MNGKHLIRSFVLFTAIFGVSVPASSDNAGPKDVNVINTPLDVNVINNPVPANVTNAVLNDPSGAVPVTLQDPITIQDADSFHGLTSLSGSGQATLLGPFAPGTRIRIGSITVANHSSSFVDVRVRGLVPTNPADCTGGGSVFNETAAAVVPAGDTTHLTYPFPLSVGHDTERWCLITHTVATPISSPEFARIDISYK